MPLSDFIDPRQLLVLRRRRGPHRDAVESPADNSAQDPVHDADQKDDPVLRARQIAKENVHQRNRAEQYA